MKQDDGTQIYTQTSIFDVPNGKFVRRISFDDAKPFLLGIHYARRLPCVTDAFGLFLDGKIIGVVTYGVPASRPLCVGLAGKENAENVRELNRLCILPEYNGGGTILLRILWRILSKCCLTERSLFPTLTRHGLTLDMCIKRQTFYTRA